MQNIIIEKPYEFIPPVRGTFWSTVIKLFNLHAIYLRRAEGVVKHEVRHVERLRASLDAGHGILITPNHCRYADPIVMGWLAQAANCHFYGMASWHLFHVNRFMTWAMRSMGAFSIYREGVDRKAIELGIDILTTGERPLIIFPEGAVSRTNDRLHALLDGVAFVARTAAKKRARREEGGKVVVHPVAIKYLFGGDIAQVADEVLTEIEERFTWPPQRQRTLMQRIAHVGTALLCLQELQTFGATQQGSLEERLTGLINGLLQPLEREWLGEEKTGPVVPRVKNLRMKMLPEMVQGKLDAEERQRRWNQLADIYRAQQVSCYPPDYLVELPSVDRILETLERFEEDLTDRVRVHGSLTTVMDVGEPIEVGLKRDRKAKVDPLMAEIETRLQGMLNELAKESQMWSEP